MPNLYKDLQETPTEPSSDYLGADTPLLKGGMSEADRRELERRYISKGFTIGQPPYKPSPTMEAIGETGEDVQRYLARFGEAAASMTGAKGAFESLQTLTERPDIVREQYKQYPYEMGKAAFLSIPEMFKGIGETIYSLPETWKDPETHAAILGLGLMAKGAFRKAPGKALISKEGPIAEKVSRAEAAKEFLRKGGPGNTIAEEWYRETIGARPGTALYTGLPIDKLPEAIGQIGKALSPFMEKFTKFASGSKILFENPDTIRNIYMMTLKGHPEDLQNAVNYMETLVGKDKVDSALDEVIKEDTTKTIQDIVSKEPEKLPTTPSDVISIKEGELPDLTVKPKVEFVGGVPRADYVRAWKAGQKHPEYAKFANNVQTYIRDWSLQYDPEGKTKVHPVVKQVDARLFPLISKFKNYSDPAEITKLDDMSRKIEVARKYVEVSKEHLGPEKYTLSNNYLDEYQKIIAIVKKSPNIAPLNRFHESYNNVLTKPIYIGVSEDVAKLIQSEGQLTPSKTVMPTKANPTSDLIYLTADINEARKRGPVVYQIDPKGITKSRESMYVDLTEVSKKEMNTAKSFAYNKSIDRYNKQGHLQLWPVKIEKPIPDKAFWAERFKPIKLDHPVPIYRGFYSSAEHPLPTVGEQMSTATGSWTLKKETAITFAQSYANKAEGRTPVVLTSSTQEYIPGSPNEAEVFDVRDAVPVEKVELLELRPLTKTEAKEQGWMPPTYIGMGAGGLQGFFEKPTKKELPSDVVFGTPDVLKDIWDLFRNKKHILPPMERLPEEGAYPTIKTDDGSLYFGNKNQVHVDIVIDKKIPLDRIIAGGWIQNGHFEPSLRSGFVGPEWEAWVDAMKTFPKVSFQKIRDIVHSREKELELKQEQYEKNVSLIEKSPTYIGMGAGGLQGPLEALWTKLTNIYNRRGISLTDKAKELIYGTITSKGMRRSGFNIAKASEPKIEEIFKEGGILDRIVKDHIDTAKAQEATGLSQKQLRDLEEETKPALVSALEETKLTEPAPTEEPPTTTEPTAELNLEDFKKEDIIKFGLTKKEKLLLTASMKDVPDVKQGVVRTTVSWLKQLPPNVQNLTYFNVLNSDSVTVDLDKALTTEVENLAKKYNFKLANSERVSRYLLNQDEFGQLALKLSGIKPLSLKDLTPEEVSVMNEVKKGYQEMAAKVNSARESLGLEPMGIRENYMTILQKAESIGDLGIKAIDNAFRKIKVTRPSFRFAKARVGGTNAVNLDILEVYQVYMHSANRLISFTKASKEISQFAHLIKTTHPNLSNSLTWWLHRTLTNRLGSIGSAFWDSLMSGVRRRIYRSVIVGSAKIAVNQLGTIPVLVANTPVKSLLGGLIDTLKPKSKANSSKVLKVRSIELDFADYAKSLFGNIGKAWTNIGSFPATKIDHMMGYLTFNCKFNEGISKGMTELEAMKFAEQETAGIMGMSRMHGVTPLQRTQLGRTLSMFNLTALSEINTMYDATIKNPNNWNAWIRLGKYVFAIAIWNMITEDGLGIPSFFPRPVKVLIQDIKHKKDWWTIVKDEAIEFGQMVPVVGGGMRFASTRGDYNLSKGFGGPSLGLVEDLVKFGLTSPDKWKASQAIRIAGAALGIGGTAQLSKIVAELERKMSRVYGKGYSKALIDSLRRAIWGSTGAETERDIKRERRISSFKSFLDSSVPTENVISATGTTGFSKYEDLR